MYKNLSEDIFDGILRSAFHDYAENEMKKEPSLDSLKEMYPPPRKDVKWIRRQIKKKRYSYPLYLVYLKRACVVVLAVISVSFAMLVSNDRVRAAVIDTVIEWYDTYVKFDFSSETSGNDSSPKEVGEDVVDINTLTIGYIPEGFELIDKTEMNSIKGYTYTDSKERYILIEIYSSSETDVMADKEYNVIEKTAINGYEAYILDYDATDVYCSLIFGNDSFAVVVDSTLDEEEMIKIAENIK